MCLNRLFARAKHVAVTVTSEVYLVLTRCPCSCFLFKRPMMNERYLATVIDSYRYLLQPVPPFTWFGSEVSIFDVGAAFRLCIVLRQLREMRHRQYLESERDRKNEASGIYLKGKEVEEASRVKNIMVALIVVYGGEGFMSMLWSHWIFVNYLFIY